MPRVKREPVAEEEVAPLEELLVTIADDGTVTDADGTVLSVPDDAAPQPEDTPAEGQRAEPPVVEAEPVFDAEGNITEFSIVPDGDKGLPDIDLDGDEEAASDEDEFGSDLDDEDEPEDATHHIDALLEAVYNRGWNKALDALDAKFSATGAFLEVSAAIEKLRK